MYNRLFNLTITRVALLVVALMAISLVALPVYNLAFAQETDTIEYPENGTVVVATFTATDPDMDSIAWSLENGGDSEDFSIDEETGELEFDISPDYENPTDRSGGATDAADNVYEITVTASDGDDTAIR